MVNNIPRLPQLCTRDRSAFWLLLPYFAGACGRHHKVSFPPELVPAILPRAVAEKLPFNNLADVLSLFNNAPSSLAAAKINDTLGRCQTPADPAGEKACATSLEGTVQTAVRMLLSTSRRPLWAVASTGLPARGRLPLEPYVIEAIRTLDGNRHVGYHVVPYPYAVYHCHTTGLANKGICGHASRPS